MGKEKYNNAELIFTLFRAFFGAFVLAALWGLVGWGLSSRNLGLVFFAWSLFLGPLVLPIVFFYWLRLKRDLRTLPLASDATVASEYFRCILREPGPAPQLWVRASSSAEVLWWERPFSPRSRQYIVLSSRWLSLSPAQKSDEWCRLWTEMAKLGRIGRRLRSLSFALWMGPISILEVFFIPLRVLLNVLGFKNFPGPQFWTMAAASSVFHLWFGRSLRSAPNPLGVDAKRNQLSSATDSSLIFAPWFWRSSESLHPLSVAISYSSRPESFHPSI